LISGELVIYFGSRRAIFAFENKNVGRRRVARHPLRKKPNLVLKKPNRAKEAKLLNNMKIKIPY